MEDIRLSIDAYTLDKTVGKQRVRAIEQDGSIVYERAEFADEVERLWTEYPEGLLDLTEDGLSALSQDDAAVPKPSGEGKEEEKVESGSGGIMSAEEMETLRSEVFLQLNDARNELWYVLELAKTLSLSTDYTSNPPPYPNQQHQQPHHQKKRKSPLDGPTVGLQPGIEPPLLPPGTFSTTSAITPLQPALNAHDLQLALAAKQEALEECSLLIDGAVEELGVMSDAGEKFWGSIRELRDGKGGRGQWAIVPRPDFGRNMIEGESAKDVIIPYALDEAPPALRARSLAAFDLDPTKLDSLTFGARTHQRLRVTLHDSKTGLRSSTLASEAPGDDIGALMESVQAEAFNEDLFNELRIEAMRSEYNTTIESRRISVSITDLEVVFEMYDIRQPPKSVPSSAQADLIIQISNLSLLRLHQYRKSQLITQASKLSQSPSTGSLILSPILQGIRYYQMIQTTKITIEIFVGLLRKSGIDAEVEISWVGAIREENMFDNGDILGGLNGTIKLNIEKMPGIIVEISPNRLFSSTTSKATSFPISDLTELSTHISQDLSSQLLVYVEKVLWDYDSSIKGLMWLDHLDGVIMLPDSCLSIMIPAPYTSIQAKVNYYDTSISPDLYDSNVLDLKSWLDKIAQRVI